MPVFTPLTKALWSVYSLNTGGGAVKGMGTRGLGPRVPIYATYEICESVYRINTGNAGKRGVDPIALPLLNREKAVDFLEPFVARLRRRGRKPWGLGFRV